MRCSGSGGRGPGIARIWRLISTTLTLIVTTQPAPCLANACVDYAQFMGWVGGVDDPMGRGLDIEVSGSYAYAAFGESGFVVIDAADPMSPAIVAKIPIGGLARNVAIFDGLAYAANDNAELHIIDISEPTAPRAVGQIALGSNISGVDPGPERVYVALGAEGVAIIDTSAPESPSVIGVADTVGEAKHSVARDGMLFVADGLNGLAVIDVTMPASPSVTGTLSVASSDWWKVSVSADRVFALDRGNLRVVDVSDPSEPVLVATTPVAEPAVDLALEGSSAIVVSQGAGIQVVDLALPSGPRVVATAELPGTGERGIALGDGFAFIADFASGVQIAAVRNARSPVPAGIQPLLSRPQALAMSGGDLFVANAQAGVVCFDVSDPGAFSLRSVAETPGSATDIAIGGGIAVVADRRGGAPIIDIRDPDDIRIVGSVPLGVDDVIAVAVENERAYLATGFSGLVVADVRAPSSPVVVGSVAIGGTPRDISLADDMAYVVSDEELSCIDVSIPTSPVVVGQLGFGSNFARGVVVLDGVAYVSEVGIQIIDVTDPSDPQYIDFVDTPGVAGALRFTTGFAYVADGDGGVAIFDSRSRPELVVHGVADLPGQSLDCVLDDSHVYLASANVGIHALPRQCVDEVVSIGNGEDSGDPSLGTEVQLLVRPNPFNPGARISFVGVKGQRHRVAVYDNRGREIDVLLEDVAGTDTGEVIWKPTDVASGVYFVRLETGGRSITQKVTLVK